MTENLPDHAVEDLRKTPYSPKHFQFSHTKGEAEKLVHFFFIRHKKLHTN